MTMCVLYKRPHNTLSRPPIFNAVRNKLSFY